jgi:hypothetical protein
MMNWLQIIVARVATFSLVGNSIIISANSLLYILFLIYVNSIGINSLYV